jgi:hypothetical protein
MFRIEYGSGRKYGGFKTRKQAENCLFRNNWLWFDHDGSRTYYKLEPPASAVIRKVPK